MTGPGTFTIGSRRIGRVERVTVAGRLDLLAATKLRARFDRLRSGAPGLIEIDLRGVREIGSVGVRLLGYMHLRAHGHLRVIPSPEVADAVHRAAEVARGRQEEATT